jgi:hypothetical protein
MRLPVGRRQQAYTNRGLRQQREIDIDIWVEADFLAARSMCKIGAFIGE